MTAITEDSTVRIRIPVATDAEIDAARTQGTLAFSSEQRTATVCPADGQVPVRLGIHPADAPAASSLGGADLVLIVQGGVLKRTTVAAMAGGGVWQPLDPDLTAIAALTTTPFGRSLLTLAGATETRTAIDAASTADLAGYQPLDADLTAIAALSTDAFGRGLLPLANAAAVRSYIGAGTVQPGDLAAYQPLDADLTAIAALTTAPFGRGLLALADAVAVRMAIGAGTSSFSGAYASLAGIPAPIGALDDLTPAADRLPYFTNGTTAALATFTAYGRSLLAAVDAATAKVLLELVATDITDLGTVLAGYLPKNNPAYTGGLSGPQGTIQAYTASSQHSAIYPPGVTPGAANFALLWRNNGERTYANAHLGVHFLIDNNDIVTVTSGGVDLASGVPLSQAGAQRITAGGGFRGTDAKMIGAGSDTFGASTGVMLANAETGYSSACAIQMSSGGGIGFWTWTGSAWRNYWSIGYLGNLRNSQFGGQGTRPVFANSSGDFTINGDLVTHKSATYDFANINGGVVVHDNSDTNATLSNGRPGVMYTLWQQYLGLTIVVPTGVKLWSTGSSYEGPTTFTLGGARPIMIQCLDSANWLIPNYGE